MKKKNSTTNYNRRDFLKSAALGTGALTFVGAKVFAGPFEYKESGFLIPEDKKLSAEWVKALFERGHPELFKLNQNELQYIGMPVGGIACGQLYLAGDGRLRLWHIFKVTYSREKDHGQRFDAMTLGGHYAKPEKQFERETRPVDQGTVIKVKSNGKSWIKRLDARDFSDITFRGEYPIGKVEYNDPELPVKINLEAFSPFIPNNVEESALPATVLEYKVSNTSEQKVSVDLCSWLENAVLPYVDQNFPGKRRTSIIESANRKTLFFTPEEVEQSGDLREDIVFEDFESGSYERWSFEGESFGVAPFKKDQLKPWQPVSNYEGNFFLNTHNTRDVGSESQGSSSAWSVAADAMIGTLTSQEFTIERKYINFLIGGGAHASTSINLVVDGNIVRTASGTNGSVMRSAHFDVQEFAGQKAQLKIIDNHSGGWGHITVDHIVFSDSRAGNNDMTQQHGYGSMALSIIDSDDEALASLDFDTNDLATALASTKLISSHESTNITKSLAEKSTGALGQSFTLEAGQSKTVRFLVTWFFPYLNQQDIETGQLLALKDIQKLKRHYFNRFNSATQVADYIQLNSGFLIDTTKLWNKTWYDSTLPFWLLDRTFIPIDCLASNTVVWFDNGRFWGWEGVECCPGTCQHVWHYAQGMSRIFPEIERYLRQEIDLGSGQNADGSMSHRDETAGGHGRVPAHDGHCGTIIRAYREHKNYPDNSFLERNYENIRRAVKFIINEDKDRDGLLEGKQTNTLDASWYGPMGWISSLYLGALAVGKEMALEMGDNFFASECDELLKKGQKNIVSELYNGEYFIHKPDRNHPNIINSNDGCLIDQVLGQSLAFQAGYQGRVIPEAECKSALESIYKYNFAPDAFMYQKKHLPIKGARIYATEGEAGTLMCTWPKGGAEKAVPGMDSWPDESETWLGPGGYFDECMNGFEYQVAAHMIYEGDIQNGLALTKAVHDRYGAKKRNPYNEIECGDHYSRSMASYGVFLALCGFDYHGPKGSISINPKVTNEDFKAPFTVAEGWGTYSQSIEGEMFQAQIDLKYGHLNLNEIGIDASVVANKVIEVRLNNNVLATQLKNDGNHLQISFDSIRMAKDDRLTISFNSTGIDDVRAKNFKIHPVPSKDIIWIESEDEQNGLNIYNLKGENIYTLKGNYRTQEVDISYFKSGVYLVEIYNNKGRNTQKIIKS
ncbi:MAG: GH116 family glycosyl-hydrolase [Carboxylicivirga sp.]|nr:GH116 family glycosyl-hydrolase [Carboxylicivirga sp.]